MSGFNISNNPISTMIENKLRPLNREIKQNPENQITLRGLLITDKLVISNKSSNSLRELSLDLNLDSSKVEKVTQNNSKIEGKVVGHPKATGYYPHNSKMEGGFKDKVGKPLHTLQDFLSGSAPYVSIAIDKNLYKNGTVKYGDSFRIPEMEKKYGKKIIFKAVDTGGAFTDKGFGRIDICTENKSHSLDKTVNSKLTLIKVN